MCEKLLNKNGEQTKLKQYLYNLYLTNKFNIYLKFYKKKYVYLL